MRRRARGGAGCQATAPLRLVRRRGRGSATPLPLLHLLCGLLNASYRFIKKIRAALEAYTKRARHVCEHFLQTTTIISRYMSSPMMTRVGMKHIKKYVEMMMHDNVSRVNGSASTNGSGSVNGVQAAVNGAADCDHVASGAADENEGSDKPNNVARW